MLLRVPGKPGGFIPGCAMLCYAVLSRPGTLAHAWYVQLLLPRGLTLLTVCYANTHRRLAT